VILNIEEDHLDFFKDIVDIRNSFRKFAEKIPKEGVLIINSDIENYEEITDGLMCRIVTYGLNASADYSASNITYDAFVRGSYTLMEHDSSLLMEHSSSPVRIQLGTTGKHNVSNSLAAIAVAMQLGISDEHIIRGLLGFTGTDRRFEIKGHLGEVTILDDYAHHPTEIAATLTTAKQYPHDTLWCIFQPHTYTRTKALLDDLATALSIADKVILPDIYAARETDTLGISSKDLQEKLQALGVDCYYMPSFDEIEAFILQNCENKDLVITMGAGDVVKIGEHLLGQSLGHSL